jgi:hypothetical protein
VAAGFFGLELGLGPFVPRLYFARPFDIGGGVPENDWVVHFTIFAPFLLY